MKKILLLMFTVVFFASCGQPKKKEVTIAHKEMQLVSNSALIQYLDTFTMRHERMTDNAILLKEAKQEFLEGVYKYMNDSVAPIKGVPLQFEALSKLDIQEYPGSEYMALFSTHYGNKRSAPWKKRIVDYDYSFSVGAFITKDVARALVEGSDYYVSGKLVKAIDMKYVMMSEGTFYPWYKLGHWLLHDVVIEPKLKARELNVSSR